jgi:hypothetical protein
MIDRKQTGCRPTVAVLNFLMDKNKITVLEGLGSSKMQPM